MKFFLFRVPASLLHPSTHLPTHPPLSNRIVFSLNSFSFKAFCFLSLSACVDGWVGAWVAGEDLFVTTRV
jgi:hypothetical protein